MSRTDSSAVSQPLNPSLNPHLWWFLPLAVALLYSLGYGMAHWETPLGQYPQLDGRENLALARLMASGDLPAEPFYRALFYPWVLSRLLLLGWPSDLLPLAAGLLGVATHALNALCVAVLARRVWRSDAAGMLCGLALGLYPMAVYHALDPLDTTLGMAFCLIALVALFRSVPQAAPAIPEWMGTKATFWLAASGLSMGIAVQTRPHYLPMLLLLPVLGWWVAGSRRVFRVQRAGYAVIPAIAGGTVMLVGGALNWQIGGEFRFLPWQGAFNLYAANGPEANGRYFRQTLFLVDVAPWENPARLESELRFAAETGRTPPFTPSEMGMHWRRKTVQALTDDPMRWVHLTGRKLLFLGHDFEQYNNRTYAFHRDRSPWLAFNPLRWGWVFPLGIGGFVLALAGIREARRDATVLVALAVVFTAGVTLFFASDRFRLPLVPFLIIGAGAWVVIPRVASSAARRAFAFSVSATLLAAGLAWAPWTGVRSTETFIQDRSLLANAAAEAGLDGDAIFWANQVLQEDPTRQDAVRILLIGFFNLQVSSEEPDLRPYSWARPARWIGRITVSDPVLDAIVGVYSWVLGDPWTARMQWTNTILRFADSAPLAMACLALADDQPASLANSGVSEAEAAALRRLMSIPQPVP